MTDGPPPADFDYGEKRPDGQYENYPTVDEGEFEQEPRDTYVHVDGCGQKTTMTGDLPESVAREPQYYTKTFCAGCGEHVPVEEVEWEDGEDWVVDGPRTDGGMLTGGRRDEVDPLDITQFQLDILAVLAGEPRYGLAIKRALEGYYDTEVNHGRLYPNLDDLVDRGAVDKSARDKRTNEYALTDAGRDALRARIEWLSTQAGLDVVASDPGPIAGEGGAAGGVE